MQKNRFLFEWKNEGKVIPMVIEVAIVTAIVATKKIKKKQNFAVHKFAAEQGNRCQCRVRE